jgi:hypothetical protein
VPLVTEAGRDDRYGMNASRLTATAIAAIVLCCALPAVAGAADYCVYPNESCGQNNVKGFQNALNNAAGTGEADRILLGADTYVAPQVPAGFGYTGQSPVEIVGSGRGQTILTAQQGAVDTVLQLAGGPGSSLRDLTIRIPQEVAENFRGLLTTSTAQRIEITEEPIQTKHHYGALILGGGVLEDSSVELDPGENTTGVLLGDATSVSGPNVLRRSVVRAEIGARIEEHAVIERSRVTAESTGITAAGEDIAIDDSLLILGGSVGTVLRAETDLGWDTNVTADGLTIYASPKLPDTVGVAVSNASDTAKSVHLTLTNSIVRGFTPLAAVPGSTGKATISASYSDYDPDASVAMGGTITGSNVSNVGLLGFDTRDQHEHELLPGSPLIDAGDPASQQGIDLDGNPRVADGDGDGIARRDLGAFELQPPSAGGSGGSGAGPGGGPAADTQAPLIGRFRSTRSVFAVARAATPRAARVARGTRLRYTLSENARVVLKIKRRLAVKPARYRTVGTLTRSGLTGVNRIRFTGRIGRRALRPGRYRAVITAIDAAGNRSVPRSARFRVAR